MKLSNIESRKLLPRFASKIAWLMDALDSIIRPISERVKSIDAPLTLEAIAALTDEELEVLYEQYGVAQYYPELSRSTRDLMLYEMCKIYRYLGTPHAIELLCNYIFDNVPLNVHVIDNLAFDEHGTLIDATLLDVFDIEVNPDLPVLSVDATARLLANIIRFSRNSQALRSIVYTFIQDFSLSVSPCKRTGNPQSTQTWPQDSLCEPVTPPMPPAYTEITLYLASGSKNIQTQITSGFTGNVNSSYVYPLYEDENLTIPWAGYNYSNDYQVGYIGSLDGEWHRRTDNISDIPDTTVSTGVTLAFVLLETGAIWLCSNSAYSSASSPVSGVVVLRIYPKEQQHYAAYFNFDNAYTNNTFTSSTKVVYFSPTGGSSARFFGHYIADNGTLVDVLDSAGSSVKKVGDVLGASSISGNSYLRLEQSSSTSRSARVMTFTLPHPTFIGWLNAGHTNQTLSSGTVKRLLDDDGNEITYNANLKYTAVCIFAVSNSDGTEAMFNGLYGVGSDDRYPGALCFGQRYGSISANRIWITTETVDDYIWAYFTNNGETATTNTSITNGNIYPLFDASGDPILYSALKSYETLEVQYYTSNGYLLRGTTKFDSFSDTGSGQLQCTAGFTNTTNGAKRIKVWIKPLLEIDIDVNFGDPVTIPAGYTVESVKCVSLYVRADTVSLDGTTSVNFAFDGEFAYCDDIDTSLFGVRVNPCIQLFAITSDTSHIGYYLSCRSSFAGSNRASTASASVLNSGGKFLVGTATASVSDMAYIDAALRRRPVWISRTDSSGNQIPYYYRIQQSVWQFQNGVFSWLGDTSDATDPAHWYNGIAVRIHLKHIT